MADDKAMQKKIKEAIKEGGKKGVDLDGVCAMGGVQFFNISVDVPEGDFALLEKVMEGANVEVDESAEERKGGAGAIGKMFYSAGETTLAIMCHVPKEISAKMTLKEWVIEVAAALCPATIVEMGEEFAKIECKADVEAGRFPLKMRDLAIAAGLAVLKVKGLIPEANSDSDDDVNYAEAAGVEW
eukprot:gene6506-3144_t